MLFDPCNTNKPGNRTISCSQIKMRERSSALTKYKINPLGTPVDTACDMETDGGGWTVIQRRTKYEAYDNNFEKDERDYERGFTTQGGALWIGYDALSYHNGAEFSIKKSMTISPDHDKCSARLSGGWWFRECNEANLNGRKFTYTSKIRALGITWHIKDTYESYFYSYHNVEMKIRDDDFGFCTGPLKS
uniref:Putative ficolin/ixoderin n=1 Tax=Ixodes ricinus TaxID=34613 RepID=A0A147BVJ6_IXORI